MSTSGERPQPGVIFDLDGTLADTLDDVTRSLNHALRLAGLPDRDRGAVRGMIGDGVRSLVSRAARGAAGSVQEKVLSVFVEHYRDHCVDQTRLYPEIDRQLDQLSSAGWVLGVLSNKPDDLTRHCCAALLSRWPFAEFAGAREGVARKPDPTGALAVAEKMRCRPDRVFFVGDSPVDVVTARSAGMVAVAAGWGYRSLDELRRADPDLLVPNQAELAKTMFQKADALGLRP